MFHTCIRRFDVMNTVDFFFEGLSKKTKRVSLLSTSEDPCGPAHIFFPFPSAALTEAWKRVKWDRFYLPGSRTLEGKGCWASPGKDLWSVVFWMLCSPSIFLASCILFKLDPFWRYLHDNHEDLHPMIRFLVSSSRDWWLWQGSWRTPNSLHPWRR